MQANLANILRLQAAIVERMIQSLQFAFPKTIILDVKRFLTSWLHNASYFAAQNWIFSIVSHSRLSDLNLLNRFCNATPGLKCFGSNTGAENVELVDLTHHAIGSRPMEGGGKGKFISPQ